MPENHDDGAFVEDAISELGRDLDKHHYRLGELTIKAFMLRLRSGLSVDQIAAKLGMNKRKYEEMLADGYRLLDGRINGRRSCS